MINITGDSEWLVFKNIFTHMSASEDNEECQQSLGLQVMCHKGTSTHLVRNLVYNTGGHPLTV